MYIHKQYVHMLHKKYAHMPYITFMHTYIIHVVNEPYSWAITGRQKKKLSPRIHFTRLSASGSHGYCCHLLFFFVSTFGGCVSGSHRTFHNNKVVDFLLKSPSCRKYPSNCCYWLLLNLKTILLVSLYVYYRVALSSHTMIHIFLLHSGSFIQFI